MREAVVPGGGVGGDGDELAVEERVRRDVEAIGDERASADEKSDLSMAAMRVVGGSERRELRWSLWLASLSVLSSHSGRLRFQAGADERQTEA